MDTKIHTRIWADLEFIELNDSEKLCYFWAVTNMNSCGYVAISQRKLARDIEVEVETLKSALGRMFKENAIVTEDGVWLKNYIGEQLGSGDSLVKNRIFSTVKKHAEDLCPDDVRESIYEAYPEVRDCEPRKVKEGASKGVTKGEGEGVGAGVGLEEIEGAIKRNGGSIREGIGLRSSNEERGKSEFKEAVAEIAMEMEKVGAYKNTPSASCYTEYDQ
tara:strand:- start:6281 stop:6934 length:654 start_codon:yes stop_codon:yes gene_type:complete